MKKQKKAVKCVSKSFEILPDRVHMNCNSVKDRMSGKDEKMMNKLRCTKKMWMILMAILFSCMLLAGCGTDGSTDTSDNDELLQPYLEELKNEVIPVREYGEETSYIQMEGEMMAHILYPQSDVAELDTAIQNWVDETVAIYQQESEGCSEDGDNAELLVDYSSYLVNENLAGVKLTGMYDRPYMAHPVDLAASFNVNLATGRLLTLEECLLPNGKEILHNKVIADAEIAEADLDEYLLRNWILTQDGIEILLNRGEYLPMSAGSVTLFYSYEELEGIFAFPETESAEAAEQNNADKVLTDNGAQMSAIDPDKPMLALTFDDGPSANTDRLLNAFAAHEGKGTFYVVGNMVDSRPDTLKRMAAEGHEIAGHSWNHRQLTKLDNEELTAQFMNTRAKIYDVTGIDPVTMRPPYGAYNDSVKEKAKELGISMIYWSVDTLDWKHKNADTVYNAVMNGAKDGAIILCHDLHKTTVDAMERAIPDLIAQGYQLVTVSEMLTYNGEVLEPGKVYFGK